MRCLNRFLTAFCVLSLLVAAGCCTRYVYGPDYTAGFTDMTDNQALLFDVDRMSRLEFLERTIESMHFPFYVWSVDARLLLANKAWEECMCINRKKAIGAPIVELFPPQVVDEILFLNREALSTGTTVQGAERICLPRETWEFLAVKWPVFDKHGRIIGVGGIWIEPPG
jgi:PAS domain-containing protein